MFGKGILIITFAIGSLPGFVFAQLQGSDALTNIDDLSGGAMFRSFDNRFKGVIGSPTLFDVYRNGLIQTTSGKWFKNDSINYDAYNDDILVKRKGTEAIVSKGQVKQFIIINSLDSVKFVKKELPSGKVTFMRTIVDDGIQLLLKETKVISEPTNTGAYSSGRSHSEFELKKTYFIASEAFSLTEIKTKKDILAHFQNNQTEIDSYIKRNRINLKKENDLQSLVAYLNRL